MQVRKTLLQTRYVHFAAKKAIAEQIKLKTTALIEDANTINEALTVRNIFEETEQKVNRIYLNGLAKGNYTLNASDEQYIRWLAMQCPMLKGNAVYKARVLHTLFEYKSFNDVAICLPSEGGIGGKVIKTNTFDGKDVKIFPNPASTILNIQFAQSKEATIIIRNIQGSIVQQMTTSQDAEIDISNILNGIIFVEIWSQGLRQNVEKIVVIH